MSEIVLSTLNAKYVHASFGLRYLMANLGGLKSRARILEFDINQRPLDIVEALLEEEPAIIGLGVYIWNATQTREVVALLKRLRPDVVVILGGPEVSFEVDRQEIVRHADFVITGEADLQFAGICRTLLAGDRPELKVIPAPLPDMAEVVLPYDLYDDEDVAHRVIYVEASRGCPFTCEFCLSSLDVPVRQVPMGPLLAHLERLLERGVRQFKFVDRTFNLNIEVSRRILEFFLERRRPGLFAHFEMIPDRLPEALRELIARFPAGALQFEVGIQTFDEAVSRNISRRQNVERLEDNFRFLRGQTGVHLHADLIVGLPGESVESFAAGFDRLVALGPQEIQVGMLKRLRGTPIVRHDVEWGMIYGEEPPYEVMRTRLIDFGTMQRLRRFARFWDLVANSGNFLETTPLLRDRDAGNSPFHGFMRFSDWMFVRLGRRHGIALTRLVELLFEYLTLERGLEASGVAERLWRDYRRGGRSDRPKVLEPHLSAEVEVKIRERPAGREMPKRQQRHLAA
jgi:radical SAM superfamily enzyme YgiQ (UPF0313 family)